MLVKRISAIYSHSKVSEAEHVVILQDDKKITLRIIKPDFLSLENYENFYFTIGFRFFQKYLQKNHFGRR